MALDPNIRKNLRIPAVCAPMFLITVPRLVAAVAKAGLMVGIPRMNARTLEEFEQWLRDIRAEVDAHKQQYPNAVIGPLAVNLTLRIMPEEERETLAICKRYGINIMITASGDPTERIKRVHDWGGKVFHDATSVRFAEKAIKAGADGITAIGAGGGGHSGTISHLVLIPKIRAMFDGTLIMAGCVGNGAAVRAAEILGADLAYIGTRFIATQESGAPPELKEILLSSDETDLIYTGDIAGVPANWLSKSIERLGLDPANLPKGKGYMQNDHLPPHVKPWKTLWSAGQGIGLIKDVPTVNELVARLEAEYHAACRVPVTAAAERLVEETLAVGA